MSPSWDLAALICAVLLISAGVLLLAVLAVLAALTFAE